MLTADQRASFDADGLLRLPGALDPPTARGMADAVWAFLAADQGVVRDDPASWAAERPAGLGPLSRQGALDGLWSPTVLAAVTALLGPGERQAERPRVLLTAPGAASGWDVPTEAWHFDYTPRQPRPGVRAVQVFALLGDLEPRGGGTLVLTGSHRLVAQHVARTGAEPRPRAVRAALGAAHPWLAELWGRGSGARPGDRAERYLDRPVVLDGVPVCVREVTGAAGDVVVLHSDCFHAAAPNARPAPRLMCTSLVVRRG